MPTNDSKLLRKVLSKWAFDELPDDKYNKGQIAIRIAEIKEMLLDMESAARSEGYKKGQRDTAKKIFGQLDKFIVGIAYTNLKDDQDYKSLKMKWLK